MNNDQVEHLRLTYPAGTVVKLLNMKDETQMPCGLMGVVAFVDDACQIHVNWQNGSSLALIPRQDLYERISAPTKEHTAPQKNERNRNR